VQLRYIDLGRLITEADGDPWAIDKSLQTGRPAGIADLAQAFHNASQCTKEADNAFLEACRRFETSWNRENGEHPINDSAEVQRATRSLGVQAAQLPKIAVDLENIGATLAEAQRTSGRLISTLDSQLQEIDTELGQAVELEKNGHLSAHDEQLLDQHITQLEEQAIGDTKATLGQVQSIRNGYSDYLQKSLTNLRTEDGYDPAPIQALDAPEAPTKPDPEANRRQNQIDAFTRIFGRAPTSATDWDTATALDPHSYDPKYDGVPANIVVGRIRPVPGQGVVRTNLFIPGRAVWDPQIDLPPYHNNLGDNRGFSPSAGPELSRVSIYVDYESGIIVARQNPSIDERTGQIRAGTPTVSALQQSNGSVLIKYSAADPFSPGGEGLAKAISFDVNGTIAIEPTAGGPRVGGSITNYPAIEIYNDRPGAGTGTLIQSWPLIEARAGGPGMGLWWHKSIGDAETVLGFNDQYPAPKAPALPHSGHAPSAAPIAPPLVATPPWTSPLGPADHPPRIGVHDPVVMLPPLPPR
jgi:hypothetical protein